MHANEWMEMHSNQKEKNIDGFELAKTETLTAQNKTKQSQFQHNGAD